MCEMQHNYNESNFLFTHPPQKKLLKIPPRLGLIPLGLTAAASTTDVAIDKNMFGAGITTLMVLNEEMNI